MTVDFADRMTTAILHKNYHTVRHIEKHIDTALEIFHKIIGHTPFPNMRMEKEKEYKAVLPVDKKHYAYVDAEGQVKTKGLSTT